MADDDVQQPGAGNFLTRKQGPFPMWVWVGGLVGVILLYRTFSGKSAAPASSSTNISANGSTGTPPNIFYLPQGAQGSLGAGGGSASVTMNRNPGNGGSTGVSGTFQGSNPPRGTFRAATPTPSYVGQNVAGIASTFGTTVDALSPLDFGA